MLRLSITKWMVVASGYASANSTVTRANWKPERSGVGKVKCRPAFGSTAQKTLAVPRRSYSLSRRASRPGAAGDAGRTSACRVIGFSSRQTTGSRWSYGRSYTSKTSSILAMYSSSRSATTHIFFPPRFEIVAQQENANGFSSYTGNQFAFDGFFRDQADGPTGAAFRRIAAYHCNQTLLLAIVEHFRRSRPLFFVQCALQAALQIPTADAAYGFGSERDYVGDLRCAGTLCQLQQSQGAQDHANLLDAAAQQVGKLSLMLRRDIKAQRWTTHTSSMRQNNST